MSTDKCIDGASLAIEYAEKANWHIHVGDDGYTVETQDGCLKQISDNGEVVDVSGLSLD